MFPGKSWMFVCEEETRINLTRIDSMLQRYDPSKVRFRVQFVLTHICLVDYSILINWRSPFPSYGVSGVLFHLSIFDRNSH